MMKILEFLERIGLLLPSPPSAVLWGGFFGLVAFIATGSVRGALLGFAAVLLINLAVAIPITVVEAVLARTIFLDRKVFLGYIRSRATEDSELCPLFSASPRYIIKDYFVPGESLYTIAFIAEAEKVGSPALIRSTLGLWRPIDEVEFQRIEIAEQDYLRRYSSVNGLGAPAPNGAHKDGIDVEQKVSRRDD